VYMYLLYVTGYGLKRIIYIKMIWEFGILCERACVMLHRQTQKALSCMCLRIHLHENTCIVLSQRVRCACGCICTNVCSVRVCVCVPGYTRARVHTCVTKIQVSAICQVLKALKRLSKGSAAGDWTRVVEHSCCSLVAVLLQSCCSRVVLLLQSCSGALLLCMPCCAIVGVPFTQYGQP